MPDDETQRDVVRSALMAMWAMATLVLFFCVVLLVYQMSQRGDDLLSIAAVRPEPAVRTGDPSPVPSRTQEVRLYFADGRDFRIAAESRLVEHTGSTVENCRQALFALIDGPKSDGLMPILPAGTLVRGVYLIEGGELVIDFSRDLEAGQVKSAGQELLMLRGIVATLTQPRLRAENDAGVRRVRFLFEGSPPQDAFPAHLDLSEAVEYQEEWTAPPGASVGDA